MPTTLACTLALPAGFSPAGVLAFHRRDVHMLAERADADSLDKGLLWRGQPACLHIRFDEGRAEVRLEVDGEVNDGGDGNNDDASAELIGMARRMLGLTQPVKAFEEYHRAHPQIGRLIEANSGLRVPLTATPFEAITWAVTGQQISVMAALSVRRRLIERVGARHSAGLLCYPDATRIAALDEAALQSAGFSRTKARTLLALSAEVQDGRLPLDAWTTDPPADEIRARLLAVRGIGPWTTSYTLMRGYGYVDGSLHGDVAVRRKLQLLLGDAATVDEKFTERWLAEFSPWRALVAAHLWAMPAADD